MSENIDEYLVENWGKKSRESLRKQLDITDGELIWHAGRLGLPFEARSYSHGYKIYPNGSASIAKLFCEEVGLEPGMRYSLEAISIKPYEKVVKITVLKEA